MLTITHDKVKNYCFRLESLLGKEFIQGLYDEYTELRKAPFPHWLKDSIYAGFHPFHRLWGELIITRDHAIKTGELRLTAGGITLLELLSNLDSLQDCKTRERVINGLHEAGRFYSSMFEAYVGAYYQDNGHIVEFPSETGNNGKQCDLIVQCKDEPVYIECKSLRDDRDSFACKRMVESFCHQLATGQVSYRVHIELHNGELSVSQAAIAEILNKLVKNEDFDSQGSLSEDNFTLKVERLGDWEKQYRGRLSLPAGDKPEFAAFHMVTLPPPVSVFQNVVLITMKRNLDDGTTKRILNNLRNGRRQLPAAGPGIIHIQTPHDGSDRLLDYIDDQYGELSRYLKANTTRINAIVITGKAIDVDKRPPVMEEHYLIPNFNTRSELPSDLFLLGTSKELYPLSDDAYAINTGFTVPMNIGKNDMVILSNCSQDGRRQLRIWLRSSKRARVELTGKSHPRIVIELKCNWEPGSKHSIIVTWSQVVMTVWIDYKQVGEWNHKLD